MALSASAARARRRPRASWARAVSAVGVIALAATVAACGNGNSSGGSSGVTKDGFKQAAQSSGPLTVWVDSTRVPAAQAYAKAHPNVKLNIVTYDGDANGSNSLQTKVDLYDRTGQWLAGRGVEHREQRAELGLSPPDSPRRWTRA